MKEPDENEPDDPDNGVNGVSKREPEGDDAYTILLAELV